MPNMEELLNQTSAELLRGRKEPLWMSKIDLEYACGQFKLSEATSKPCKFAITGGNLNGCYTFKKRFYGLSGIPTKCQKKKQNIEVPTSVWFLIE